MLNTCMFSRGAGTTADIESTKNENNGDKKASCVQRCKQDVQDLVKGAHIILFKNIRVSLKYNKNKLQLV